MLQRLYVDNYKCFVNFECQTGAMELILGENGGGKTAFCDVLSGLRDYLTPGLTSQQCFPANTLTAWDTRPLQTYELELAGPGGEGTYQYRLAIEQDRRNQRNRVKLEELRFDQTLLYRFDGSDAHLFRDDGSAGPIFPHDWSRSALATIPERPENQRLTWFRRRMDRIYIFSPDPPRMGAEADSEVAMPDRGLHQLAAWLRHLSQESVDTIANVRDALREVIPGLEGLKLERAGESSRVLKLDFRFGDESSRSAASRFTLPFDQLSDGQRNMVALFTVLEAAVDRDSTICLDEPDNYLALSEIQPWVVRLRDRVEERQSQCLLISHHPEVFNYLAAKHGLTFTREEAGPAHAGRFAWDSDDLIAPAELIARGWK
jgi:predicted ATPase